MTLLLDMNMSPRWGTYLEAHGFKAVHWSSLGVANAPDRDLMNVAQIQHYVILTQDLDFGIALATSARDRPSVVQIRSADLAPEVYRSAGDLRSGGNGFRVGQRCPAHGGT